MFELSPLLPYNLFGMNLPNKPKNLILAAVLLSSLSWTSAPFASVSPQEAARQLEKKFAALESLEAYFEQDYYSASIGTPLQEKGRFYFQKPDRMRWEYQEPEPQVYVFKEGRVLNYVPDENQLYRYALSPEQENSAVFTLLTGRAGLEDNYLIEQAEFPTAEKSGAQIKLTPRQEGEFTHLLLEINEKTWLIERIVTVDWAGNKQEFRFRRVKFNPRLPASLFELTVPPQTEIIDDIPPVKKQANH